MQTIKIDLNKNDVINFDALFHGQQGDSGYRVQCYVVDDNSPLNLTTDTVTLKGKTAMANEVSTNADNLTSNGFCLFTLPSSFFNDVGQFKGLNLIVDDGNGNIFTSANIQMTVLDNNVDGVTTTTKPNSGASGGTENPSTSDNTTVTDKSIWTDDEVNNLNDKL